MRRFLALLAFLPTLALAEPALSSGEPKRGLSPEELRMLQNVQHRKMRVEYLFNPDGTRHRPGQTYSVADDKPIYVPKSAQTAKKREGLTALYQEALDKAVASQRP